VYTGSIPNKAGMALDVIRQTLDDVSLNGLTDAEIARGKGQLRGAIVLGQEDTGSRMTRIAKAELVSGELPSVNQTLDLINAVSAEDVHAVARHLFSQKPIVGVVGPYQGKRDFIAKTSPKGH
jgi:predicted Zn-dependent peptidase